MENFSKHFFEGGFGLERETLRLDRNGRLSQSLHPFNDTHLERDFCEDQLEIITGVNSSVKDAVEELSRWDKLAKHDNVFTSVMQTVSVYDAMNI